MKLLPKGFTRQLLGLLTALAIGAICACVLIQAASADSAQQVWVVLDSGHDQDNSWALMAARDHGRGGGMRPCVTVELQRRYSGTKHEGALNIWTCSRLLRGYPPNIAVSFAGRGYGMITAMGIAAAPSVHTLRIESDSGEMRFVPLRLLSKSERRASGIKRGRFGLDVQKGRACVVQIVALDGHGRIAYKGPRQSCGRGSS